MDSEAESLSEPSQGFEPQEDDEDTLWEVIEITLERPKEYKVRWKGTDPKTQKPWAQSWVPKKDCTDDLVIEWKKKKKEMAKKKATTTKRGRDSTASKKTARASTTTSTARASSSKLTDFRRSTSTIQAGRSTGKLTEKHPTSHSTKTVEPSVNRTQTKRVPGPDTIEEISEEEQKLPPTTNTKGKKRKLAEAESANPSANTNTHPSVRAGTVDVNINVNKEAGPIPGQRPKKKRKVEVEVVNFKVDPEDEEAEARKSLSRSQGSQRSQASRQLQPQQEESYEVRKVQSRVVVHQAEEVQEEVHEEEEVEDQLSQMHYSPAPLNYEVHDMEVEVQSVDKGKGRALDLSEGESEVEIRECSPITIARIKTKTQAAKVTRNRREKSYMDDEVRIRKPSPITKTKPKTQMATIKPTENSKAKTTTSKDEVPVKALTTSRPRPKPTFLSKPKPPMSANAPKSPTPPPSPSTPPQHPQTPKVDTLKIGPPKRKLVEKGKEKEVSVATDKPDSKPKAQAAMSTNRAHSKSDAETDALWHLTVKKPRLGPYQSSKGAPGDNQTAKPSQTARRSQIGLPSRQVASSSSSESANSESSDEDSDTGPPPLLRPETGAAEDPAGVNEYRAPTEEHSVFWEPQADDAGAVTNDQDEVELVPQLSQDAIQRLEVFDREVGLVASPMAALPIIDEGSNANGPQKRANPTSAGADASGTNQSRQLQASRSRSIATSKNTDDGEEGQDLGRKKMFRQKVSPALFLDSSSDVGVEENVIHSTVPNTATSITQSGIQNLKPKVSNVTTTTTTTTTSAPEATVPPLQLAKSPTASYNSDIVPETDPESHSQEPDLNLPTGADAALQSNFHPPQPSTPPGRSTLKSRMKPKTPSRTSSAAVTDNIARVAERSKSLHPLPMLSPSTFHPHLPSSLPDSIIEMSEGGSGRRSSNVDDEEELMSSIEQFDSPDKKKDRERRRMIVLGRGDPKDKPAQRHNRGESASDIWESDVVRRGQEIAEAAKKRTERSEAGSSSPPVKTKRTIAAIQTSRSRAASTSSHASHGKGPLREGIVDHDGDQEMVNVSTAVAPPTSGPPAREEESQTLQAMEEAYVDLRGGAGDDAIVNDGGTDDGNDSDPLEDAVRDPVSMRQEEEESTQDLYADLQEAKRLHQIHMEQLDPRNILTSTSGEDKVGVGLGSGKGKSKEVPIAEDDEDDPMDDIPQITIQDASRAASARPYSPEVEVMPIRSRLRSRSNTPTVTGQKKANLDVPPKNSIRAASVGPSRQSSISPNDNSTQLRLDIALVLELVNSKSEEIAGLQAQLVSERTKNEGLQQEVLALQPHIIQITQLEADKNEEAARRLTALEAHYQQLLTEKSDLTTERSLLVSELESAKKGKADADKDRDFFREQYTQASAYVGEVRDENKELEKRALIAEDQAHSGVALVKASLGLRMQTLEKDLTSWRRMAEFAVEHDRRTNGEEMRRRAAEEPELRARCCRQEQALEVQQERLEELEEDLRMKTEEWATSEKALEHYKKETLRLNEELNEVTTKLYKIASAGDTGNQSDDMSNGNEFVYECINRLHHDDMSSGCHEPFSTLSGLHRHLSAVHLDEDIQD